jgi:hypothetical protein
MSPGAMTLTRTPVDASSIAALRARPMAACLDAICGMETSACTVRVRR